VRFTVRHEDAQKVTARDYVFLSIEKDFLAIPKKILEIV